MKSLYEMLSEAIGAVALVNPQAPWTARTVEVAFNGGEETAGAACWLLPGHGLRLTGVRVGDEGEVIEANLESGWVIARVRFGTWEFEMPAKSLALDPPTPSIPVGLKDRDLKLGKR